MKKLRANINTWFDTLDKRWRQIPLEKQYRYTWYFFLSYLILTIAVVFKVWYEIRKPNDGLTIEHIKNPIIKKKESAIAIQDSVLKIIKNKSHERK